MTDTDKTESTYLRLGKPEKTALRALARDPTTDYETIADAATAAVSRGIGVDR